MRYNYINKRVARKYRNISDEQSQRLLYVKCHLQRARGVARVTRQQVNLVSGIEVQQRCTSDGKQAN